jgi:hypothetical protein
MTLYSVRPCGARNDPAPGVQLMRQGENLNRLSPAEARELGAELILAAGASEAQWDQGSPAATPEPDHDNDYRFEQAGVDGYEL